VPDLYDPRHAHSEADVVRACVDAVRAARFSRPSTLALTTVLRHHVARHRLIRPTQGPFAGAKSISACPGRCAISGDASLLD